MDSNFHILAIETSGTVCDVAVVHGPAGDPGLLAEIRVNLRHAHSEILLDVIDDVLFLARVPKETLSGLAVSIGPGSFTGLRIGLSAAKGLVFGLDLPLVGVPTLDALAFRFHQPGRRTIVAIGARQGECYLAQYENRVLSDPYRVIPSSELGQQMKPGCIVITDRPDDLVNAMPGQLGDQVEIFGGDLAVPDAVVIGRMGLERLARGEHDNADSLVPLYVQAFKGVMG